jgi:hypothetical protein
LLAKTVLPVETAAFVAGASNQFLHCNITAAPPFSTMGMNVWLEV